MGAGVAVRGNAREIYNKREAGRVSTSNINGNPIYYDEAAEIFRYASDDEPINWNNHRPCPKCGKRPFDTGEDACMGYLPGVVSACCGHGGEGYIEFENGVTILFRGCEIDAATT